MQIGLLQCDHVDEQYRHLVNDYSDLFIDLFQRYAPEITFKVYDVCHHDFPASLDECDGYLVTGSRKSVYDDVDWIHELSAFVRQAYEAQQKLVGICFGHQMIAHALGGKVAKSSRGWGVGIKRVDIDQPRVWMKPEIHGYHLILSHQDQIEQLPDGAITLGGNAHCPNSIIQVGAHVLGIQAHPEFTREYAETLMLSRLERIGQTTVEEARQTFNIETDEQTVTRWIASFLTE